MRVRRQCFVICLSLFIAFAASGQIILNAENYDNYLRREASQRSHEAHMLKIRKELDEGKAAMARARASEDNEIAAKRFEAAINSYNNKLKQAADPVFRARAYSEVRFIYYPPHATDNNTRTFNKSWVLEEARLLTGYLLSIKDNDEYIVAVEGQKAYSAMNDWGLYIVSWGENANWGEPRTNDKLYLDISSLGNGASLDQKLKYIEAQIDREKDRRIRDNFDRQKQEEEERKRQELRQQVAILGKQYMREREPYKGFMFIDLGTGKDYTGEKLVIKGYTPGPGENFVAFFHVPDQTWFSLTPNTPLTGKVFKIAFDKSNNLSVTEIVTYTDLGVPGDIQYSLRSDPYIFKIVERLVNAKLGLISAEENVQLKNKDNDYFAEYRKRKEEESKKRVATESKFVYRSYEKYLGDEYLTHMTGIGIKNDYSNFSGVFVYDEMNFGVSYHTSNTIIRSYKTPTISFPRFDITISNNEFDCVLQYDRLENPYQHLIIYSNGDVYYGDYSGKEIQNGVKYFTNGDMYSGLFQKSQPEGFGRYFYANGGMYDGKFIQGLKQGKGIEAGIDGGIKEVVYEKDKVIDKTKKNVNEAYPHVGYSSKRYPSNDLFMGVLQSDRKSYKGIIQMATGDTLHGVFETGNFYGLITRRGGIRLYGEFKFKVDSLSVEKIIPQNSPLNRNFILYPNGDLYNGNMSPALTKNGAGAYYYTNGEVYIGNFTDDKRSDNWGVLTYPNRNVYRGMFVNDKIDGFGEFIDFSRKERYLGNFKDGKRDGEGTIFFTDNTLKKVIYKNGVLQQ